MLWGRAQNYVQLKSCYELAMNDWGQVIEDLHRRFNDQPEQLEKYKFYVYGIVTTAKLWVFTRFDGVNWLETNELLISNESDAAGVTAVLTNVYKILVRQDAFLKELFAHKL